MNKYLLFALLVFVVNFQAHSQIFNNQDTYERLDKSFWISSTCSLEGGLVYSFYHGSKWANGIVNTTFSISQNGNVIKRSSDVISHDIYSLPATFRLKKRELHMISLPSSETLHFTIVEGDLPRSNPGKGVIIKNGKSTDIRCNAYIMGM